MLFCSSIWVPVLDLHFNNTTNENQHKNIRNKVALYENVSVYNNPGLEFINQKYLTGGHLAPMPIANYHAACWSSNRKL
jgi:hypothetical protein